MAPIHAAVTRRHFLRAFGVAAVALALPERPTIVYQRASVFGAALPMTVASTQLQVGDMLAIDGRLFVVTIVGEGGHVIADYGPVIFPSLLH